MGDALLTAVALVLVIEGVMPLVSPGQWRRVFEQVLKLQDGQIRFIGLISIMIGLIVLLVTN